MNELQATSSFSRWSHASAILLACATLVLILVGSLVTTYDAGMAVPDWPSTYGDNLFLYSWRAWLSGPFDLFIEHGHRLMGATVGLITIAFVVSVFLNDRRTWMRVVSIVTLLAVIGQGCLGGMRVLFDDRQLAMTHGCIGPAFFGLSVALCVFTSRWWHATTPQSLTNGSRRIQRLALLTLVFAYVQLVLGASLRHIPIDATVTYFRGALVFHLIMAAAVMVHAALFARAVRQDGSAKGLAWPAWLLLGFVAAQILLGGSTWVVKYGWPAWFADWPAMAGYVVQSKGAVQAACVTAHVVNGSLILGMAVRAAARSLRAYDFLSVADELPSLTSV